MNYERPILQAILTRLSEPRSKIQILSGARQVGKTTIIKQVLNKIKQPYLYSIAESGFTAHWIDQQWLTSRSMINSNPEGVNSGIIIHQMAE